MQHPTGGIARCRASRTTIRTLAVTITSIAATAWCASAAHGAQYVVDACQHPDGATAGHNGWSASSSGAFVSSGDECAGGGGLTASWDSSVSHANGDSAAWTFSAPPGTSLAALAATRSASVGTDQPYGSPVAQVVTDQGVQEVCARPYGCASLSGGAWYGLNDAGWVSFGIACAGANGCAAGGTTAISLRNIQVALNDTHSPVFASTPSGTLMSGSTVARTRTLSYSASDNGGGVYRHRLLADETEVLSAVVDANGGACAPYLGYGSFSARVPCKPNASGTISYDTAGLPDGTHDLRLEVLDATNSNRVGFGPWQIVVDNAPPTVGPIAVTGTPRSGDVLTGTAETSGQNPSVTYQWLRAAPDGSSPAPIDGATGASHRLTDEDVGHKILLTISATDHGGTTTKTTSPTDAPFTGKVVAEYCSERPTGARDECGDLDGDGKRNRVDDDLDGDGIVNGLDQDPYDAAVPAKSSPSSSGGTTSGTGSSPSSPSTTTGSGRGGDATATTSPAAADTRAEAPLVNPKDPSAVAVVNPIATAGPNGSPADAAAVVSVRFEKGSGSSTRTTGRIVAGFDERVRIRGTITTQDGRPIAGARVFLVEKDPNGPETSWHVNGGTVSRQDGSLLLFTSQGGRSRDMRLVYFPQGGRDGNRASNPLSLLVRQDARLRLSTRALHNGQTLWFRGRVRGRVPAAGATVQLQVRLRTGWFTFRRLTASRRTGGRFTAPYTFRRTTRTTRYRFRAKVIPHNASAYAVGYSRTTSVLVKP